MSRVDFNLYLITDRLNLPAGKNLFDQVEAALRGGVRAVQLREKDLLFHELLPLAQHLRQLTRRYGAKLFINGNLDVALSIDADGVHLPANNPPITLAKSSLGEKTLIGVSTHSIEEAAAAAQAGADFVTFGPVYPTPSKAAFGDPIGLEKLQRVCHEISIPVFALGGVTPERKDDLKAAGCDHVACIGTVLFSDDPEETAKSFNLC